MDDEVSIAGTVNELQKVRASIAGIRNNEQVILDFETEGDPEPYGVLESTMIIKTGNGPAFAEYQENVGIVVVGNISSLESFASFFDFDTDAELGDHNHWDDACDSDYVTAGTLPIVVSVV